MKLKMTIETCEERLKLMRNDHEILSQHQKEQIAALESELAKQRNVGRQEISRLRAEYDNKIERLKQRHEAEKKSIIDAYTKKQIGRERCLKEAKLQLRLNEELIKCNIYFRFLTN